MKKVLIIAPHMDDEVLGTGGVICKYVKDNCVVKVCFVCNRAYGHKYDSKLIKEEKKKALDAKNVLGYQEHVFLDLNDERIDERVIDVVIPLEKVFTRFKPHVVYIPHKGDNNQDHRTVFNASMVVMRTFSASYIKEIYSYEVPSSTEQAAPFTENVFMPNCYVNIKEFIEKKKKALGCFSREKRMFPHPRSWKSIETWAIKRGVEAYLEYAEAFMLIRMVRRD